MYISTSRIDLWQSDSYNFAKLKDKASLEQIWRTEECKNNNNYNNT